MEKENPLIGNVTLRNRLVMAPMISNLANPDGSPSDSQIEYLARRALGGVGLIITEYTYINSRNSRGSRNQMGIYSDLYAPKLRRLTDRIHSFGTPVFCQLVHAGGKALTNLNSGPNIAPSPIEYNGLVPNEMSIADIEEIIEDFVHAARIARQVGFDGVEIHGAHGYLVQEFISPSLNMRSDRYGGNIENRVRFPNEIVASVKSEIDMPVGIRLSLYEDDQGGYDADYGLKVADSISGIDYVHFSAGRNAPPGSSASFYSPHNHILRRIGRKSRHPTMVVGSINSPADIDEALRIADFVSLGRALLADPGFSSKIILGNQEIRPCIRCNQGCRNLTYGEVRCTVNPETGFESLPDPFPGHMDAHIEISGAGIKGMEAAVYAARHGMDVVVYEISERIGGQINEISDPFKKSEFQRLIDYYWNELKRLGVEIRYNEAGPPGSLSCSPDILYPELTPVGELRIDSNIYKYHDDALRFADEFPVFMTERSLSSLDRSRAFSYRKIAEEKGVKFVKDMKNPDISLFQSRQYDILAAMQSGRSAVIRHVAALQR